MRNFTTLVSVALLSIFGFAGVASAGGTSTYNKYTNTVITGGTTQTSVDATRASQSITATDSTSIKVEAIADLGDSNFATVNFDGTNFTANATSSNNRPVDPVATIYFSEVNSHNLTKVTESADIHTFSSNKFHGTEYTHEVGTTY